nr:hypothetical protein [Tanacetum cinerariifolium]GEZ22645.1 hypothetical protein [Tanacetum cinerariifolium]
MSSRSRPIKEAIFPKFDMHTFTSSITVDEVNNIAEQYGIHLELHPHISSSTMTIDNLSEEAIDMLYKIGLTMIWKHVGFHPTFKDVEGNSNVTDGFLLTLAIYK